MLKGHIISLLLNRFEKNLEKSHWISRIFPVLRWGLKVGSCAVSRNFVEIDPSCEAIVAAFEVANFSQFDSNVVQQSSSLYFEAVHCTCTAPPPFFSVKLQVGQDCMVLLINVTSSATIIHPWWRHQTSRLLKKESWMAQAPSQKWCIQREIKEFVGNI